MLKPKAPSISKSHTSSCLGMSNSLQARSRLGDLLAVAFGMGRRAVAVGPTGMIARKPGSAGKMAEQHDQQQLGQAVTQSSLALSMSMTVSTRAKRP